MRRKKQPVATSLSGYKGERLSRKKVYLRPLGKKYTSIDVEGVKINFIDFL